MIVVVTGGEQVRTCISDAVKREITQGLQEGHGMDKGIVFSVAGTFGTCAFFDFETCEEIDLRNERVQLEDDDIRPLCVNLGRFKRLKKIDLVSRGM